MHLRTAQPADAGAVAELHVRCWQAAYRGLISDTFVEGLAPEDRAGRYTFGDFHPDRPHTIVAIDHDGIYGFATTGAARDADLPGFAELLALYVAADRWGQGIGRALMQRARTHLLQHGFAAAVLWVLAGNDRAQRFYRADGWACDGARRTEVYAGESVSEARFRRALP